MPERALLAAAALAAFASGCGGGRPEPPRGVLLVTVGALRRDALGAYGAEPSPTPSLDALARAAVVFEDALTTAPLDLPAHASLLTGLEPRRHGARDDGDGFIAGEVRTLAELLAEHGFRSIALVSRTTLATGSGLARGFERFGAPAFPGARVRVLPGERNAEQAVTQAILDLRELDESGEPFLYWLHLSDPHHPFDAPGTRPEEPAEIRYAAEVRFADRELGRLFAALEQEGPWEHLAVVATSDHGVHLDRRDPRGHGEDLSEDLLRVPLIVRAPGLEPARVAGTVSLADVAPTVLDLLALPLPPELDGASLLPCIAAGRAPHGRVLGVESWHPRLAHGLPPLAGVVRDELKLVRGPGWHLSDRSADPAGAKDLFRERDARSEALRAELERRFGAEDPKAAAAAPEAAADRLAALAEAEDHLAAGREGQALLVLRPLARSAGDDPAVLARLAGVLLAETAPPAAAVAEAEPLLRRAIHLRPEDPVQAFLLARCLGARADRLRRELDATGAAGHRADQAAIAVLEQLALERLAALRRSLQREPGNERVLYELALALAQGGAAHAAELETVLPLLEPAVADGLRALAGR